MALSLELGKATIEVISSHDPAIGVDPKARLKQKNADGENEDVLNSEGKPVTVYARYLETLDEGLLELKEGEEPTRFVLRKVLSFDSSTKVKSMQGGTNDDGKMELRIGFTLEDVRAALIDVKNPGSSSLAFRKDSDGKAHKELVALLEAAGIADELFTARQGVVKGGNASLKKS